jgi:hypothetical protein
MNLPAPLPTNPRLETTLAAVELQLTALGDSLRERDSAGIDRHATELHRALAAAVDEFARAARTGSLPPALRHRLASAGSRVAAQRESLARATAALDRAIDVLIPRENAAIYSSFGADRAAHSGSLIA